MAMPTWARVGNRASESAMFTATRDAGEDGGRAGVLAGEEAGLQHADQHGRPGRPAANQISVCAVCDGVGRREGAALEQHA